MKQKTIWHPSDDKHDVPLFLFKILLCLLVIIMPASVTFAQVKTIEDIEKKTISLSFQNEKLDKALATMEEASGFRLIYPSKPVDKAYLVNLPKEERSVAATLKLMLQGTNLDFKQSGNSIVLFMQNAPIEGELSSTQFVLQGVVTDAVSGDALPYTSVIGKVNKGIGVFTDETGKFSITLPSNETHLVVSFTGYKDAAVTIGTQRNFKISLEPAAMQLDESIVVGYQTRKKSTLTGSVKALDGGVIQDKPVASFDKALQGQVAGVYVSSSGAPGGSSTVLIRGVTSTDYTSPPLYILDGTPISPSNFASLNPNDIEQYTVLKDAAATSIYGSLAANGVVLLTSKRGKNMEKTEVTYRFQIGTSMLTGQNFTMMNTAQRLQYEEELGYRTLDPSGKYYISKDSEDKTKISKDSLMNINTNWRDEIYRNGIIQSHELSLRGGSENTKYFASLNYFGQEGILPNSDFQRFAFRINLDQNISKHVKVGTSTSLSREFRESVAMPSGGITNPVVASYMLLPYMKPYNDDGELIEFQNTAVRNPLLYYSLSEMSNNRVKLVTNLYAEIKLFSFLTFKSSLGYDYQALTNFTFISPDWSAGSVSRGYADDQSLTNTNLFTLRFQPAKNHNFTVLLGEEYLNSQDTQFSVGGEGLASDKLETLNNASTISVPNGSDTYSRWATLSFFSQASYNYDNRYFLDLSLRSDGSSRFRKGHQWGTFWSVGASWNVKREKFLENSKVISAFNVFASTGTTGNSNVGTYNAYATYNYGGNSNYNGQTGSIPATPGNPNLTWETVWKNNLGAEVTLLGKYRFKLEGYINRTYDMLFAKSLSLTGGFVERQSNIGGMQNTGVELEFDVTLIRTRDFSWRVNGNASYTQTLMKDIVTPMETGLLIYENDAKFGNFYLSQYAGVDPLNGSPLWYDLNGNITSTYSTANRVRMNKTFIPPYTGGFGSDFSYKQFSASVFFSWVADKYMMNNLSMFYDSNGNIKEYNQSVDMLNYWKKPGDVTPYPHPSYASNQADTRYLENASFLRLKNVMLSYTLDPEYLKRTKLIRCQNLCASSKLAYVYFVSWI